MNTIKIKVNFTQGTCETTGINLVTGDYNSTKLVFQFDREDGTKIFEMKSPSEELVMVQEIQNNEIILYGENDEENIASIFTEEGNYIFEISLYENESKLTSAKGKLKVKPEQVVIDGEVVEAYLPVFDQLLSQVSTALAQTDNINIDGSKSGKITTITITYKDGTTKELKLEDGKSIEYNWQGTQLGIRQEGQSEYVYVDLKGEKGDAGAIKMLIVAELPSTGQDDTIYLLPIPKIEVNELPSTGEPKTIYIVTGTGKRYIYESEQWIEVTNDNNYFEYVYINNKWEELGEIGVQVDLTDYYTKTETNTLLNGKANTSDIPTKTSQLTNDSDFTTKSYVDGLVGDISNVIDAINGEVI